MFLNPDIIEAGIIHHQSTFKKNETLYYRNLVIYDNLFADISKKSSSSQIKIGWGWQDVLPFFKASEDQLNPYYARDSLHHSVGGPLPVGDVAFKTPLSDAFLNAGKPLPSSFYYPAVNVSIAILFMLVIIREYHSFNINIQF